MTKTASSTNLRFSSPPRGEVGRALRGRVRGLAPLAD